MPHGSCTVVIGRYSWKRRNNRNSTGNGIKHCVSKTCHTHIPTITQSVKKYYLDGDNNRKIPLKDCSCDKVFEILMGNYFSLAKDEFCNQSRLCYNGYTYMEIMLRKLARCQLDTCRKPLELSLNRGTKRRYCNDAHRKYAWKKRHWIQYLSWQRDYVRRQKYLPKTQGEMNASKVLTNPAGEPSVA